MWPPVAVGGPLALGLLVSWAVGDPLGPSAPVELAGWALLIAFGVWNGWALVTMARHRTALLPEEHYLEEKFGSAYTDYAGRVRRWL
jgi:protein-S-isoprenylcysteine O-methyltransferase Ste14